MCPTQGYCRLCFCSSNDIKELVDEHGQYNEIYEIAAKYFDPLLLTTAICANCWQHINDFYEFQQSVLKAQTDFGNIENNDPVVKLEITLVDKEEDNSEADSEEKYFTDLKNSNNSVSEDELPPTDEEANKEDLQEDLNISMSNTIDSMDSNPFESEDEIPLGQYSIEKIRELENRRIAETKNHFKKLKSSNNTDTSNKLSFSCMFCDKKYKDGEALRVHTVSHTGYHPYQCPYCETKFNGRHNMRRHVRQFHPSKLASFNPKELKSLIQQKEDANKAAQAKFVCSLCDKILSSSKTLHDHVNFIHKRIGKMDQCPHCPSKFLHRRNLRRHIKTAHPDKFVESKKPEPFDLNSLGKDLNSTEEHTPNYDDYDAFIAKWKPVLDCHLCNIGFSDMNLLRAHFKLTHPEKKCRIICCDLNIMSKTGLVDHLRCHLDPNSFKCRICGRCCISNTALNSHMRRHTAEKPFQCEICQKRFLVKCKYIIHMGYHSTEKNEFCKICNRGYANTYLLKKHIHDVHEKRKQRLCEQCGKHCDRDTLKDHLCAHAGIDNPKWRCKQCGTQLQSRSVFRRHTNACYLDAKAIYICSECNENFSSKSIFDRHNITVHSGVCKPKIKCIVCDKHFANTTSYRTHAAIHTGDSQYQCPHCPLLLKQKKNFGRHLKMVHPLEFDKMIERKRSKVKLSVEEENIGI